MDTRTRLFRLAARDHLLRAEEHALAAFFELAEARGLLDVLTDPVTGPAERVFDERKADECGAETGSEHLGHPQHVHGDVEN